MTKPLCFESEEQYSKWKSISRVVKKGKRGRAKQNEYCFSCLPEYKAEMIKEGKCSHKEIVFVMSEHNGVVGKKYEDRSILSRVKVVEKTPLRSPTSDILNIKARMEKNDEYNEHTKTFMEAYLKYLGENNV